MRAGAAPPRGTALTSGRRRGGIDPIGASGVREEVQHFADGPFSADGTAHMTMPRLPGLVRTWRPRVEKSMNYGSAADVRAG